MLYTPKISLTSWQQRHAFHNAVLCDKYKYTKSNKEPMLEDIVSSPTAIIASTLALTTLAVPFSLSALMHWAHKESAIIQSENEAQSHFQKVLTHYKQDAAQVQLRCTYRGGHYVTRVSDKYVVFIDMKSQPKKADIQHEVLHIVGGDFKYDLDQDSWLKKAACWARYFTYMEPRVILRTKRELLG
jgi:hypothetical protein